MEYSNEYIINKLQNKEFRAYIIDIMEDDYGCEERLDNDIKVIVKLHTTDGILYKKISDRVLVKYNADVGSFVNEELWSYFK